MGKVRHDGDLFDGQIAPAVRANHLYYGDNLTIMRAMPSACVDLIYLDPPFNSQRTYNLIYKQLTGLPLPEQEEAFCDAWELDAEKDQMARDIPIELHKYGVEDDVVQFWWAWLNALRTTQPRLLAYLVYMTYRLFEMRRLLKPTGSLYLHCDPAASHYIKVMLDGVFGHSNFRNEIIWKRTNSRSTTGRWPRVHDVLLYYTAGSTYHFAPQKMPGDLAKIPHTLITGADGLKYQTYELTAPGRTKDGESGRPWRGFDPDAMGRHWANGICAMEQWDEQGLIHWPKNQGFPRRRSAQPFVPETREVTVTDVWTDVDRINQTAKERMGFPTQKPIALLRRILLASTRPGDVVFDPFCGCGTTIAAAHETGRTWLGCDIAILSVQIVRDVLAKRYGLIEGEHYEIGGVPRSLDAAHDLFNRDPRQFQHWVIELAGGFCNNRLSGDHGIDGRLYFETADGLRSMVISVKGGHVSPQFVRELRGTLARERTELAGFICLNEPTRGMAQEAAKAGMFRYKGAEYPRMQIRTVGELLAGRGFQTPSRVETLSWERQTRLAV